MGNLRLQQSKTVLWWLQNIPKSVPRYASCLGDVRQVVQRPRLNNIYRHLIFRNKIHTLNTRLKGNNGRSGALGVQESKGLSKTPIYSASWRHCQGISFIIETHRALFRQRQIVSVHIYATICERNDKIRTQINDYLEIVTNVENNFTCVSRLSFVAVEEYDHGIRGSTSVAVLPKHTGWTHGWCGVLGVNESNGLSKMSDLLRIFIHHSRHCQAISFIIGTYRALFRQWQVVSVHV